MGRRRRSDLHLPKRMYERRGKFYFDSPITGKWEPLGDDLGAALAKYGQIIGPQWSGRTVGDVIDRYKTMVTPTKRSVKARDEERASLDRLKRVFGAMAQDRLTSQHMYVYVDKRIDERPKFRHLNRPAPSAAKHEIALLRLVLAKGIRWGAGTVNAAANIELDASPRNERDVTDAEYQAVYALATERMQIAMDLASNIGQRRADLLKIRPKHDFTADGILIAQGKRGAKVLVEWSPGLRAAVKRAEALKPDIPREYLLRTRSGQPYSSDGFSANWQRLMKRYVDAGGERFKFHDLRAKAATDKHQAGELADAQQLLGHTSPETTRRHYIRRPKATRAKPVR